jgi:hypothetical protein
MEQGKIHYQIEKNQCLQKENTDFNLRRISGRSVVERSWRLQWALPVDI